MGGGGVPIHCDTGFTFACSAFTGGPPGTKRPYVRYIIIIIYMDIIINM